MEQVSTINLFGFLLTLALGFLTILVPRRYAFLPILVAVCYLTIGQQIIFMTANFYAYRILIFFCWFRLMLRREIREIRFNMLDAMILLWLFTSIVTYVLLFHNYAAFINRFGRAFDVIGFYFYFRFTIHNLDDIYRIIKVTAIVILPLAIAMLVESFTGRNIFYAMGGVPEQTFIRGTRFRCQGPFRHPILAGSFGAAQFPLFIALWWGDQKNRALAVLGALSATAIMISAASSGPLISYFISVIALLLWPAHRYMRAVRWGVAGTILALHLFMKAPVWYLFDRLGQFFGSVGWHRSFLISQTINYFEDWWLLGVRVTSHWMPLALEDYPDRADITNQYILEGVNGGLVTMLAFITIIIFAFKFVGRSLKRLESEGQSFYRRMIVWVLGVSLVSHVMSFTSVAYFDQIWISWYMLLAMISTVYDRERNAEQENPASVDL